MRAKKHISIVIETQAWEKLHYIAQQEHRADSNMAQYFVYQGIQRFEAANGKIPLAAQEKRASNAAG